ncbi:MAG: Platelet-activating factor acetylhydrolase plasma/intracellular isoform [Pedosphaera sp.]|nr:Platelet-activating factor acetylhydrolase plasma/intracellular isoform [Pedosphaera sp.]
MKHFNLILVAALFLFVSPQYLRAVETAKPHPYKEVVGPYQVQTVTYDWTDQKRNRQVPVRIYYPKAGKGSFPVVIFSHGLGGSRDDYDYLGASWASHGYICVHPQHIGSDDSVWKNAPLLERLQALQDSALNLQNAINRPYDITFVIDQLKKLNQDDARFKNRLDLDRLGMAGHSFGSYTTLAIAGEVFSVLGGEKSVGDPRVKAAIAMSSPIPHKSAQYDLAYGKISIPCFHMTGTLDTMPFSDKDPLKRRVPFDHINKADQFLVTFKDADHMTFSGHIPGLGNGDKDPFFQNLVLLGSIAFWDAYLKNDPKAKAWFTGKGFDGILGNDGKFEKKLVAKSKKANQPKSGK